jgi:hypothetical protein
MADALAINPLDRPARHRRHHDRGFGVSIGLSHAKVAREPKPPAEIAKPKPAPAAAPAIVPRSIKVEGRVLASFADYDGLWGAIRARVDALGITREELDRLTGLPDRYCAKVLGPAQKKKMGRHSLGAMLGSTGSYLVLVENAELTQKILARCEQRKRPLRPAPRLLTGPANGRT